MNGKLHRLAAAALLLLAGGPALDAADRKPQGRFSPLAYSMRPVRKDPSAAARTAFARFAAKQGKNWQIRYNPRTALPEAITGGRTKRYAGGPEQAAASFFSENGELLKIDPAVLQLALKRENMGITHLQYQQYYQGLPVEFSYARAHVTAAGEIAGYQARFEPDIKLSIAPGISEEQAGLAAAADLGAPIGTPKTRLVIFPDEEAGTLKLAWKIRGRAKGGLWIYYVDARTGAVLLGYDDLRRYTDCNPLNLTYAAYGYSSGLVYPVSPIPTGNNDYGVSQNTWVKASVLKFSDQYFWIGGYANNPAVTDVDDGEYCSDTPGKVFSTFKGPYFAVSNFRGPSAHYDNGSGVWKNYSHTAETPHPYENDQNKSYPLVIPPADYGGLGVFAKAMPRFDSFWVGDIDNDADVVNVKVGTDTVGMYLGRRSSAFYGASAENPSYSVMLQSNESGTNNGFIVTQSSYMYLPNASSPATSSNPGTVVWTTAAANTANFYLDRSLGHPSGLDEGNAFYHLNKMRRYFQNFNKVQGGGTAPADLDIRVPVMVHASGAPDASPYAGMQNAFYDMDKDAIFLGDGPDYNSGFFRSFALDGTIVRHEYAHLAVHRIFPITNFGESGAVSEALSDYFSLASFWKEGLTTLDRLGHFIGPDFSRAISGTDRIMPGSWRGEIYNDSGVFSQTLYTLRNGGSNSLGTIGGTGVFNGLPMADFLVWAALFYFPDSFLNFRDAMIDACTQYNLVPLSGGCTEPQRQLIRDAFTAHGIPGSSGDSYDVRVSTLCGNNNGAECATDISTMSWLSGTIYPAGDLDFYSLPIAGGDFSVTMSLPGAADIYKAYSMFLYDASRRELAGAWPDIETITGACPSTGDCPTYAPSVTLSYPSAPAGRYYLLVAGGPTNNYGSISNSGVYSASPYTLTFAPITSGPRGGVEAHLDSGSSADNDLISFTVNYTTFAAYNAPVSTTLAAMGSADQVFDYVQLLDGNNRKVHDARTNLAGSLLQIEGPITTEVNALSGQPVFTGKARVKPGFRARYPAVGTVALEVYGRNRMGGIISMGVSRSFNLSTNTTDIITYNNVLRPTANCTPTNLADCPSVKYDLKSAGNLTINVYTQTGTLVKVLYDGPAAGSGKVHWDRTNSSGGKVSSGIYFVKAKGPGLDKTDKIAIIR